MSRTRKRKHPAKKGNAKQKQQGGLEKVGEKTYYLRTSKKEKVNPTDNSERNENNIKKETKGRRFAA